MADSAFGGMGMLLTALMVVLDASSAGGMAACPSDFLMSLAGACAGSAAAGCTPLGPFASCTVSGSRARLQSSWMSTLVHASILSGVKWTWWHARSCRASCQRCDALQTVLTMNSSQLVI